MKKFLSTFYILSFFLPQINPSYADTYKFFDGRNSGNNIQLFGIDNAGAATLLKTYNGADNSVDVDWTDSFIDEYAQKYYFSVDEKNASNAITSSYFLEYDVNSSSFTKLTSSLNEGIKIYTNGEIKANETNITSNTSSISTNTGNISSNDTDIANNASNISSNDTDIASNASNISSNDTDISGLQSLISTKSGSTTTARIGNSTKNH